MPGPWVENKTLVLRRQAVHRPKQLEAGPFAADVASFRLHLAAENKAAGTVRTYTEAALWFAAAHLLRETGKTRWDQVGAQDVQRWTVRLLGLYSDSYARNQFRGAAAVLPVAGRRGRHPRPDGPAAAAEGNAQAGALLHQRGTFETGARPAGAARSTSAATPRSSRCSWRRASGSPRWPGSATTPDDPYRSDVDLAAREVTVRGKGGRPRTVKLSHEAARRLDRYLRARSGHELAWRPELWLGEGTRGPLDRSGIYQLVVRRGEECGVLLYPHRFRHHFCQAWLDRGGAEGDLMELAGWSTPQMIEVYGGTARGARARRSYDRVMSS